MKPLVRLSLLFGNVLHHYETSLFGWAAPFLSPIFFPNKSEAEALLLTFALLPLNYLAKPLGALFWGYLGDKWGRKPVLITTLFGMSLSTFAIGCLPSIQNIWMPLALLRVLQGFFSAGEEKGAALLLLENATDSKQRSWLSALYDASGILGIFLASLLTIFFGAAHWRYLFWLAAATGLLAALLRNSAQESLQKPTPFSWKIFWTERFALLQITIVCGFSYANYFLLSVFLNGLLPQITSLTKEEALSINTHLLWIDFVLLLVFGALCRHIKKEYLMGAGALLASVTAIPLFMQLPNASFFTASVVRLAFVLFGTALAAPYHSWKLELLPQQHRFLLGSTASTLGAKLFGAPMPLLSTWLIAQTGHVWSATIPIVILGLSASALILYPLAMKETGQVKEI